MQASENGICHWTAASVFHCQFFISGYLKTYRDIVLAQWDPSKNELPRHKIYRLQDFFSDKLIERGLSESEHGGSKHIFNVAAIHPLRESSKIALVIGGYGHGLGASTSACVVAVVGVQSLSVQELCLVDCEKGASGTFVAPDGALFIDCCGSLHVVRMSDEQAMSVETIF